MTGASLRDLVERGRLERVPRDRGRAERMLAEAEQHLESAEAIAARDSNGAYALLYDAARKAVAGHMLASGYRATIRPGAHEVVAWYAETKLTGGQHAGNVRELDRMRRTRNRSEYAVRVFGEAEIQTDLRNARGIVAAVRKNWPR